MRKPISELLAILVLVCALGHSIGAAAAPNKISISEVLVNVGTETFAITGSDFDATAALDVELGNIGDISSFCSVLDIQTIQCDLQGSGFFPPGGDYRLLVNNGGGANASVEFDVTVVNGGAGSARRYTKTETVQVYLPQFQGTDLIATCDAGGTMTGGGWGTTYNRITGVENRPEGEDSWYAKIVNLHNAGNLTFQVYVRCVE